MRDDVFSEDSTQRYKRENTKHIMVRFYPTDMALCDCVKFRDGGIAPYIKRLICENMERNGVEYSPDPARNHQEEV